MDIDLDVSKKPTIYEQILISNREPIFKEEEGTIDRDMLIGPPISLVCTNVGKSSKTTFQSTPLYNTQVAILNSIKLPCNFPFNPYAFL